MSKIKVIQIKSPIGRESSQRKTLISLGLNKINREKIHNENPAILGMINKVKHLVKTEKV
jgi:large subunit ribosomal protein L30|tara:strand:- start:136 stop:315 length:180 start_codon:yes stop_codon:yes gene_type:complete